MENKKDNNGVVLHWDYKTKQASFEEVILTPEDMKMFERLKQRMKITRIEYELRKSKKQKPNKKKYKLKRGK